MMHATADDAGKIRKAESLAEPARRLNSNMSACNANIANVMLGRGRGGIEQAFLDYNEALTLAGYQPVAVISTGAGIETQVRESGAEYITLSQWGWWDVLAARRLRRIFDTQKIDAVVTHGNRALSLAMPASGARPVIAAVHNYNVKRVGNPAAVIATTEHLARFIAGRLRHAENVTVVPNIARVTRPAPLARPFHDPPVIGAMGRLVEKKGFEVLCAALADLKSRGVVFKAVIAGDGDGRNRLERTLRSLGLRDDVALLGWIEDSAKGAFWSGIDIFCLPSLHEPFGIVLLEAWAAGKAVITTDSEGPAAFVADGTDAMVVPRNDSHALAQSMRFLLEHPERAHALALNGYDKVAADFTVAALAQDLNSVLTKVLS
jgi:glycosyltransferase involved in cell wall biosynthesis